jgi:Branched-chain amino acid transport system / permease component
VLVYIITAAATAMVGAFIFLQRLRISPDAAFSVNDWTAFVIFITVIGGIGRIEGPIVGTIVFFALRQTLADLGTIYLARRGGDPGHADGAKRHLGAHRRELRLAGVSARAQRHPRRSSPRLGAKIRRLRSGRWPFVLPLVLPQQGQSPTKS